MSSRQRHHERVLLRVEALRVGYGTPLVHPLAFTACRGEVTGLRGPNGAGKSTVLAAIATGDCILGGVVQRRTGVRLGYLPQQPPDVSGLPLTGHEYLRIAHAPLRGLPNELLVRARRRLDRLSGGELQMLHVHAQLAGPANLVLLDEPTNHLAPDGAGWLREALCGPHDKCVLVVSHEDDFLRTVCGRIVDVRRCG